MHPVHDVPLNTGHITGIIGLNGNPSALLTLAKFSEYLFTNELGWIKNPFPIVLSPLFTSFDASDVLLDIASFAFVKKLSGNSSIGISNNAEISRLSLLSATA